MKQLGYDTDSMTPRIVCQPHKSDRRNDRGVEYTLRFWVDGATRNEDGGDAFFPGCSRKVYVNVKIALAYDTYNNEWYVHTIRNAIEGIAEVSCEEFNLTLETVERVRPYLKRWDMYISKMKPHKLIDYLDVARKVYGCDEFYTYEDYKTREATYEIEEAIRELQYDMRDTMRDIVRNNPDIATEIAERAVCV